MALGGRNVKTSGNLIKVSDCFLLNFLGALRAKDSPWVSRSEQANTVSENISGGNEFGGDIAGQNHQGQYLVIGPQICFGDLFRHLLISETLNLGTRQTVFHILNKFQRRCNPKLQGRGSYCSSRGLLPNTSSLGSGREPDGSDQRTNRSNCARPGSTVGGSYRRGAIQRRSEVAKEEASACGSEAAASNFKYSH
ncbi:hypothetical protein [Duganella phyllosphaerae]|nr:hypothetical protein [Duganella phyllosphaerae]